MAKTLHKITIPDGTTLPIDGSKNNYGTCSTAAATAAKVATLTNSGADNFDLSTGVTIHIKFTYSNTATSPTLNVNGTGAKAIMRYGTTAVSTTAKTS